MNSSLTSLILLHSNNTYIYTIRRETAWQDKTHCCLLQQAKQKNYSRDTHNYNSHHLKFCFAWPSLIEPAVPQFAVSPCRVHKIVDSTFHLAFLLEISLYKVVVSKRPNLLPAGLVPFYACFLLSFWRISDPCTVNFFSWTISYMKSFAWSSLLVEHDCFISFHFILNRISFPMFFAFCSLWLSIFWLIICWVTYLKDGKKSADCQNRSIKDGY